MIYHVKMSEGWTVQFLNSKVEKEFLSLQPDMKANYWHVISLIREFGPHNVGMPYIKPLGKKLWEVRIKGRDGIARAIYTTIVDKKLVILHVFIKKTQQTPQQAIELALKRMKEILA
jgi:phage-related protein